MTYVCVKPGCFNLTNEVWCTKHRLEHEAKKVIDNFKRPPVSSSQENPDATL